MNASLAPNPQYIEAMQRVVEQSHYPHLLGMTLARLDIDVCVVEVDLDERHTHGFGLVHGGVLATLIDSATWWSAYMRIPADANLVNVDLKLNYLKALQGRGHLRGEGRCLRAGRQISYSVASIFDETGDIVAHGTSTLMAVPGKGLKMAMPKFLER